MVVKCNFEKKKSVSKYRTKWLAEIASWEKVCKVCNVATMETNIIWLQICLELYFPTITIYKLFMKSIEKKKKRKKRIWYHVAQLSKNLSWTSIFQVISKIDKSKPHIYNTSLITCILCVRWDTSLFFILDLVL